MKRFGRSSAHTIDVHDCRCFCLIGISVCNRFQILKITLPLKLAIICWAKQMGSSLEKLTTQNPSEISSWKLNSLQGANWGVVSHVVSVVPLLICRSGMTARSMTRVASHYCI